MHEFSIASNIMDIVAKTAQDNGISSVAKVKIKVGELRSVLVDSLLFAFKVCSEGTVAEGGVLDIDEVPTACMCAGCKKEFHPEEFHFLCPYCGGTDISITAGEELFIESIEGQ
jgi:hydrogenase nickel incorporation protein HypA/HybF